MQPSSLNRGSSSSGSSLSLLSQRLNSLTAIVLERERVVQLGLKPSASTDAQVVRGLTSLRGEIVRGREQRRLERQVGLSVGGGTKKKQQQQRPAEDAGDALEGLAKRYINLLDLMSRDETGRRQVMELGLPDELVVQEPATQQQGGSSNDSNAGVSFQLIPPTPSMEDPPVLGDDAAGFPARSQASAKSHAESSAPFRDDPYDHGDERATSGSTWTSAATGDRRPYSDHAMDEESAVGGGDERDDQQLLQGQRSMMDDQDARLAILSDSIHRQTHLSRSIGSELDLHADLLEETDQAMDRTAQGMRGARRRLDRVARGTKDHLSTVTIVILILILLLLIIVFKT